jgi:hypothetical protein
VKFGTHPSRGRSEAPLLQIFLADPKRLRRDPNRRLRSNRLPLPNGKSDGQESTSGTALSTILARGSRTSLRSWRTGREGQALDRFPDLSGFHAWTVQNCRLQSDARESDRGRLPRSLGNEGFTWTLASGDEGSLPIDAVLEENLDPEYMAELALYQLAGDALKAVEESGLTKSQIAKKAAHVAPPVAAASRPDEP